MINVNNISNQDDLLALLDDIGNDEDEFIVTLTNMDRNYLPLSEYDNMVDNIIEFCKENEYIVDVEYDGTLHLTIFKFTKEN